MVATITVWKIKKGELRPHRIYYLNDPVITSKLHFRSEIDKIIHKTVDGDAYVYYRDYKSDQAHKVIKIGILDQTWPDLDEIPFEKATSERLNELKLPTRNKGLISSIVGNLTSMDEREFIGKYYKSIQFFNNFTFFAHSTLGLASKIIWLRDQGSNFRETNLMSPWCELILGFDRAGEHVYYLGNEKKPLNMG